MNVKQWKGSTSIKRCVFIAVYLLLALLMYWIVADDWTKSTITTETVSNSFLLPENAVVEQTFTSKMDCIEQFSLVPHFNTGDHPGNVILSVYDEQDLLMTQTVDIATLVSDQENEIVLFTPIEHVKNHALKLVITHPVNTGMALWSGSTINTGRYNVSVDVGGLTVNQMPMDGCLVLRTQGYNTLQAAQWFWPCTLILLALVIAVDVLLHIQLRKNKQTFLTVLHNVIQQYKYLLKQLVWRDFRVKYRESALGVLWSLMNPLLTMLVYFFIFSTLFQSDIIYFPVYLMSGIVLYNFFTEGTSQGLGSIVDNSGLITKVYMPKVIYPLSKVLSSAINLCISFIPLLFVMLISGVPFNKSLLLLPFVVLFLVMFVTGMSLILSTLNVFFRDTKFLWGVLLTLWNFLTPIFYPETIIPDEFLGVYRINPLYQIVYFMRSIIIDGVSPEPIVYLNCLIVSVVPLLVGLWIFRHKQDRFVLHL